MPTSACTGSAGRFSTRSARGSRSRRSPGTSSTWLLRLQGVYPTQLACSVCGRQLGREPAASAVLLPGERVYRCAPCAGPAAGRAVSLSGEAVSFLRASARVGPDRIEGLAPSPRALRELEAVHRTLIAAHLEKDLKSARVLRELRGLP